MKKGRAYPPDLRPLKGCGWFLDAVQYGRDKAATMEVYLLSVKISSPMLYNAKGLTNLRYIFRTKSLKVSLPLGVIRVWTPALLLNSEANSFTSNNPFST